MGCAGAVVLVWDAGVVEVCVTTGLACGPVAGGCALCCTAEELVAVAEPAGVVGVVIGVAVDGAVDVAVDATTGAGTEFVLGESVKGVWLLPAMALLFVVDVAAVAAC